MEQQKLLALFLHSIQTYRKNTREKKKRLRACNELIAGTHIMCICTLLYSYEIQHKWFVFGLRVYMCLTMPLTPVMLNAKASLIFHSNETPAIPIGMYLIHKLMYVYDFPNHVHCLVSTEIRE